MTADGTTAGVEGPAWDTAAAGWAQHWAGFSAPAREAVARAAGLDAGMSVLDIGCGSGEFCALVAARGARVCGVDAAPGMVEVARRAVPDADLRVGPIERLPWPDASFDVVTAFNALQFSADVAAALREARRVTRDGGRVAVCNWGRAADREMEAVFAPLSRLKTPRAEPAPPLGDPGVLEELGSHTRLVAAHAEDVDVPYAFPDRDALDDALRALVPAYGIGLDVGEPVIPEAVAAAAPYRRADGSYRFENRYRYVVFTAT